MLLQIIPISLFRNFPALAYMTQQVGTTDIYYYPRKRRLGQGATSLVFQGYFQKVEILAAIKEIKKKDSEFFGKELDAFKALIGDQTSYHPNIVRLFHWTEYDDMLYFAMEQATSDLRKLMEINKTNDINEILDRKTTFKISFDSINGVKFLHENNILHRDIKPENILIFENNKVFSAKLGDFGVSRKISSLTSTLSMSRGTEVWMSPEAINALHNDEPFPNSRAIDIFSLGMTIYFTFSKGNHPFARSEKHGKFPLMNIKDPDVDYTKLEKIDIHDYNTDLLSGMMQKCPKDRLNIHQVVNHSIWKNGPEILT